jgi:hypothetical protein
MILSDHCVLRAFNSKFKQVVHKLQLQPPPAATASAMLALMTQCMPYGMAQVLYKQNVTAGARLPATPAALSLAACVHRPSW